MLLIADIPHVGELRPQRCWIYALVDPRTNEVRYIGCSQQIITRSREHVNGFSIARQVSGWIKALKKQQLKPLIFLLEAIPATDRYHAEIRWIELCVTRGARLLNTIHMPRKSK